MSGPDPTFGFVASTCPFCGAPAEGTRCPACQRDPTARRLVCGKCSKMTPALEKVCCHCGAAQKSGMLTKVVIIVVLFVIAIVASLAAYLAR